VEAARDSLQGSETEERRCVFGMQDEEDRVGGWFTSIGGDGSVGPSGPDFWTAKMHQTVKSNG
jgi:hypothetical protein